MVLFQEAQGNVRFGGERRVFRNSVGEVLLQFGKEVCVDSAVYAEFLALQGVC